MGFGSLQMIRIPMALMQSNNPLLKGEPMIPMKVLADVYDDYRAFEGNPEIREYLKAQDLKLKKLGIAIEDSAHLDPEFYKENPDVQARYVLGQLREVANSNARGLSMIQAIFQLQQLMKLTLGIIKEEGSDGPE
jgi:hypothetical protein